ncbi:OmpW/AlkL family protein [Aurantiacibacter gangjinensis]|uniref:Membrane protein n=1 Tax=Aurantiacibacter gangjinensis TaxID=502682 RepID=A0A0G9MQB7_9SPHN|nr:OmpW family outer membrane protein [Aurantiacibacter gangjinensis]APE28750.1 Outer membrane protein W precursor [Aurantiacibacter gangjinensis]KLE32905.1 membrane protein [Aurantiacibacter gangjinensis]
MKASLYLAAAAASLAVAAPAAAQDADRTGDIQVRVLATAVLPDGEINNVDFDDFGLPANSQTEASDNITPTASIEYFISNNFSLETIAGVSQHDVDGVGGLAGLEVVSDAQLIPATLTAKYHVDLAPGVKPYIGAGPAYFIWFNDDAGAGITPLGVTDADLSNEFGVALQAGVDFAFADSGFGISLDAKRYFIDTTATFSANGTDVFATDHTLDPWVLSAGVNFTF